MIKQNKLNTRLKNILQSTKITTEEMNTVISNKVIKVNV